MDFSLPSNVMLARQPRCRIDNYIHAPIDAILMRERGWSLDEILCATIGICRAFLQNVGVGNTSGGLWRLMFGSGAGNGGDANTLYFLNGINGETAGLFAAITSIPEPPSLALLALGLAGFGFSRPNTT